MSIMTICFYHKYILPRSDTGFQEMEMKSTKTFQPPLPPLKIPSRGAEQTIEKEVE